MKLKVFSRGLTAVLFLSAATRLWAQGSTISYQGQLSVSGSPANTNYDFRFAVYDAVTNGNLLSLWLTNAAVPVSNGLFQVGLNFGNNLFKGTSNGSNDWLEVDVRAVGATAFTSLTPRQPILPAPYAIFAISTSNLLGSLAATQISGTISASLLSGAYTNVVNFSNVTNTFAGTFSGIFTGTGTFSGNGAGLTNLNAANLATGTVADARLSANIPLLNTNQTFTGTNTFTGPNTFSHWNNSFQGSFYGNGLVGWNAVAGTSQSATRDHGYILTNPLPTTVSLPTSPLTNGDIVRVSGAGAGGWSVTAGSGQTIVGSFASYSNCFPSQLSTSTFTNIAMSADGVHLYRVDPTVGTSAISASSDSGQNWSAITKLSGYYSYVACSANGKIVYAAPTSGAIWKSFDGGVNWSNTSITTSGFISCTADGSRLFTGNIACSGNGNCLAGLASGTIYLSNSPASWTAISSPATPVSCVAVSSDCTCLVAGTSPGLLYASANHGATWTALTSTNQYWSGVCMSPDGSKLAAVATTSGVISGGLYRAAVIPLPTTTANLTGSFGAAVELQYLGNGQFMPVSSTGTLWAN